MISIIKLIKLYWVVRVEHNTIAHYIKKVTIRDVAYNINQITKTKALYAWIASDKNGIDYSVSLVNGDSNPFEYIELLFSNRSRMKETNDEKAERFKEVTFTKEELETEEWKDTFVSEDYQISTLGRFRNGIKAKRKRLIPRDYSFKYQLIIDGKVKVISTSKLVAEAFLKKVVGSKIWFKDGNTSNIKVSNLVVIKEGKIFCSNCKKTKDMVNKTSSYCKKCMKEYDEENKEKTQTYLKKWYLENIERAKTNGKIWREENKESISKRRKRWREENKGRALATKSKRRSCKLRAYPHDISKDEVSSIIKIYDESKAISKREGKIYNVDHIIPLQAILPDGKRVLGAHRPSNLQIMFGVDNYSKQHHIDYEDLDKATDGVDYIHVPNDYFEDVWKYPNIGFDVKQKER